MDKEMPSVHTSSKQSCRLYSYVVNIVSISMDEPHDAGFLV